MFKLASILLFLVMTLSSFTGQADHGQGNCTSLNAVAAKIPNFIEDPHNGIFINLMRTAAKNAGLEIDIRVYQKKRAVEIFERSGANVLFPHSSAGKKLTSYKSDPIFVKRDFAFVRTGDPVPETIEDLEGLFVGLTHQYAYPKSLTNNINIKTVNAPTDVNNIKMLSNRRFDVSVIEERSGLEAIRKAGVDNITYDKSNPLVELKVWVMFEKTECGKILAGKINTAFQQMKKDGSWASIMRPGS